MRAVLALLLVGGCSFRAGVAPTVATNGDARDDDAAITDDAHPIDARLIDARPIDARPIDARPIDAPRCPAGYATVAGAPAAKQYKIFNWSATAAANQSQPWPAAVQACTNDGTHLAFPANAAELSALIGAIAVDPNGPYFWVGLTDAATEGTWLTVLGGAAPYLLWDTGQPNGDTQQNCAAGYDTNSDLFDYYCTTAYPFACECD